MNWQPIDTIPKDYKNNQTSVLLYFPEAPFGSSVICEGYWFSSFKEIDDSWETPFGSLGDPSHWIPLCPPIGMNSLTGMNSLMQHRPNYFSGWENETFEFDTLEELLALPWVKGFADPLKTVGYGKFHQFSVGERNSIDEPRNLIAEYNEGKVWYVVGRLKKDVPTLPTWVPVYAKEEK